MASRKDAFDEARRCRRCGDVIGVYEPMIRVVSGHAVRTSWAAQDEMLENADGEAFHVDCYDHGASPVTR
jgi:hypothetical protein